MRSVFPAVVALLISVSRSPQFSVRGFRHELASGISLYGWAESMDRAISTILLGSPPEGAQLRD